MTGAPDAAAGEPLPPELRWLCRLGEGRREELDLTVEIEGRLPAGLSGTLYRNGPGLYERAGFRKWTLLDGDGLIRALTIGAGTARYRTRFVRTRKFEAEDAAGRFLYPTWTTPAPSRLGNLPGYPRLGQAGVTAVLKQDRLYAFDEVGLPYQLSPETLATLGAVDPYEGDGHDGPIDYKAHTKTDGESGDWVLVGCRGHLRTELHVLVKDRGGRQIAHVAAPSPRGRAYFHDFFWAGRHAVFHLHPALLSSPLPVVLGFRPYTDGLHWRPEEGGLLHILDTAGRRPPATLEVPACWMWHALNAHVTGDTILADFIGYDEPGHFLGPDAALRTIMQGRRGVAGSPGTLRRFVIDLGAGQARMETIAQGPFEFPMVHPARVGRRHRLGYMAHGEPGSWHQSGVARIDTDTGSCRAFSFGTGCQVGEPVFAPHPGAEDAESEDQGWLLCEVLDGASETTFVAILDAARIEDGPVARLHLGRALPMSFHGWWEPA